MLRENDEVRAYYSVIGKMFADSVVEKSLDYIFEGYVDDGSGLEPPYQHIYFGDVKNIYRYSPHIIKSKKLKFHPDDEKAVFKQLLIKDEILWTKEKIREIILETDAEKIKENIQTILKINQINILEDFKKELTMLKHENCHVIATITSDYIEGQLEILKENSSEKLEGIKKMEEVELKKEEKSEEKEEKIKSASKTATKKGRPATKKTASKK